jgi:ferritin-like metal-binding protein YciE
MRSSDVGRPGGGKQRESDFHSVRLLTTNLNEEKAADKKLSTVALRKGVNRRAAS